MLGLRLDGLRRSCESLARIFARRESAGDGSMPCGGRVALAGACIGACLAAALPCGAGEPSYSTYSPDYLAALPGYSFPSKAYGTTGNGVTVSGIYGRQFAARFSFEVNFQSSTFETGTLGGTDFYQNGATLDIAYALTDRRESRLLTPFVLVGAGAVYDDFYPNNRDGFALLAEVGVGIVTRPLFTDRIRLRFDARYAHDGKEGGHPEPRLLAGIEIPLGRVDHPADSPQASTATPAR